MRNKEDDERDAFDSQGKLDRERPSPRGTLSDAWKGRAKAVDGMLGSSGFRKVNSVAVCYFIVLLILLGVSFQHHMSQSLELSRLSRSSKQWESLYSQSLEEIIDWKKKLEQEKKLAAEFAKNADLLEGTLKRVREEKSRQEEEAVRMQVDAASKDKLREQLERKLQQSEDAAQAQLQEIQQEVQVKKLELEAMHRELEETKQAVKYHKDTVAKLNADKDVLQVNAKVAAAAARNKTAAVEATVQDLRDELKNATRRTVYLEEQVMTLSNKNKVLETEARSKLDSTSKRMQEEVDAANAKADAAQQAKRVLEERVADLESKVEQSQARVTKLEEAADAAEKSRTSERERLQSEIREKEQRLEETEAAKRNEEAERERKEEAERKRNKEEAEQRRRDAQEKADAQAREDAEASEKEEAQKRKREETQETKTRLEAEVDREREEALRAEGERKAAAEQEGAAERDGDGEGQGGDEQQNEGQQETLLKEIQKESDGDNGEKLAIEEGAGEAL